MDLSNSSIQDRIAARNNNNTENNTMFNSNTSNTKAMTNIKSVEIVLNIPMTSGTIPASSVETWQAKRKSTIINTRSAGHISYNSDDDSVYSEFYPLPNVDTTLNGKNNRPIIIFHMEDGSAKTLNKTETVKFWANVLNQTEEETLDTKFKINANPSKADYDRNSVEKNILSGRYKSLRIFIEGSSDLFTFKVDEKYGTTLYPKDAEVIFHAQTVETNARTLGFLLNEDFFCDESADSLPKFHTFGKETTSTKRREGRKAKAQSSAGRRSALSGTGKATAPAVEIPATPAPEAQPAPAATVEAPVAQAVDAEKEALRAENAELKTQINGLREDNKSLKAEMSEMKGLLQQLVANQAQPAPAPAPVVEEAPVSEEPVEEAIEEPAAKEVVEEPVARRNSRSSFFSGLNSNKKKAAAVIEDEFNFNDEE